MMKNARSVLAALTVAALVALSPAAAQQTPSPEPVVNGGLPDYLSKWFPGLFGRKGEGPRPEETLVAPFAAGQDAAAPAQDAPPAGVLYQSSDGYKYRIITDDQGKSYEIPEYGADSTGQDLAKAHRRPDQIADWLVRATSEIFTMDSTNYKKHLSHLATGMSAGGLAEFNKFMQDSNILRELETQGMKLQGYVEEPPLLLNEGAVSGRYRWLFEMPVTVTFLGRNTTSYEGVEKPEDQTLRFMVRTQIGRVEKGPSDDNVIIETWSVRSNEPAPAPKKP